MVGRLLEDCPSGWEEHLTPQSMRFLGVGQDGGGTKNARSPSKGNQPGLLAKGVGVAQTSRRMVVRNSETLKEVTSEVAIRQLKGEGKAMVSPCLSTRLDDPLPLPQLTQLAHLDAYLVDFPAFPPAPPCSSPTNPFP